MAAQHAGLPIVVGVDGSDRALNAVRWAAVEAVQRNVQLHVVTAFVATQNRSLSRTGLGDNQHEIMRRSLWRPVASGADEAGTIASCVVRTFHTASSRPLPGTGPDCAGRHARPLPPPAAPGGRAPWAAGHAPATGNAV
jgi:hypothetical protein